MRYFILFKIVYHVGYVCPSTEKPPWSFLYVSTIVGKR